MSQKSVPSISRSEEREVRQAGTLAPRLIYEVIKRTGDEELRRPLNALIWSGVAAGILISFSVIGEAILRRALPDTPWRALVESSGYSIGFVLVILGRMQLFTENTITTVFPILAQDSRSCIWRTARLWSIVLGSNVVGAFFVAFFYIQTGVLAADLVQAALDISHHAVGMGTWQSFVRGVPAGVLIAALVWILAQMETGRLGVIVLLTWLIAAADFTHVVAGSVEFGLLVFAGELGLMDGLLHFWLPVLAGNVLGGTMVFTAMAWAQVRIEVEGADDSEEKPQSGHSRFSEE